MKSLFTLLCLLIASDVMAQTPVANAGSDRSAFVNETLSLDGSLSTGGFDGLQTDGRHSMRWSFGYGGWTYEGGLVAPVAYPASGTHTVTLTVCNSGGTCASDTAIVTISAIPEGAETVLSDTGNPVANMANLQAQVDSKTGTNSPVITLPVGFVARGTLVLKHRTVANYMTIRTAGHAGLPNGTSRVSPSHAGSMAIIETAVSSNIIETPSPSSTPARYYRFLGIQFRKADPTFTYTHTFVWIGTGSETDVNQLPDHIMFDRCYFNGGSTTSTTLRGLAFRANDSSVVNSYFHRFKGFQVEVQAILTLMGNRQAYINNFLEGSTENYMSGGSNPSITNHVPTDVVFRRNYLKKDLGWKPDDPSFYGTNMVIKNLYEIKLGKRFSVQGNIFETHWLEDQPGYGIVITVRNDEGFAPWSQISFVDFAHNKIIQSARGLNVFGADERECCPSLPTNRVIIRHNTWAGINWAGGVSNTFIFPGGPPTIGGPDRLWVVNNSTDQNGDPSFGHGRLINFESGTTMTNFVFSGNIGQGYFNHSSGTGATAFQLATGGSYSAIKNGFYRSNGANPPDNTTVASITDVKYSNLASFNLVLLGDSPFLTTGLGGNRAGPDTATLDSLTLATVTGSWGQAAGPLVCRWNTTPPCQAQ